MGILDDFNPQLGSGNTDSATDFATIDSNDKAQALHAQGKLSKLYLMPIEFGGEDSDRNILYVTDAARSAKEAFDARVHQLLEQGQNLSYNAMPDYRGDSFIPSQITVQVSGDQSLTETIPVW